MKSLGIVGRYGLLVVGFAMLVMLVMDFNIRTAEARRLSAEKNRISAQVTQLVQTKSALETQIAYATSPAAVADWARGKGGRAQPGDVIVKPLAPSDSTPMPTPAPVVTPQVVSNWDLWVALFFDLSAGDSR